MLCVTIVHKLLIIKNFDSDNDNDGTDYDNDGDGYNYDDNDDSLGSADVNNCDSGIDE